jgi:autotransporter-associated beta strand protein
MAHALALVREGTGSFTLAGANTYSGDTTVIGGALSISANDNLGSGGALHLESGTTLKVTASFTLSHAITVSGDPAFDVPVGTTFTVGSPITGAGNIDKTGTGALILSGANTYSGGTTVDGGTLRVDGAIISDVTVNAGGTLGGKGTTGNVTVESCGTLSPGDSPGILHTGNVVFAGGAHFATELGGINAGVGGYDHLAANGTVNLGGATLDLSFVNGFIACDYDLLALLSSLALTAAVRQDGQFYCEYTAACTLRSASSRTSRVKVPLPCQCHRS